MAWERHWYRGNKVWILVGEDGRPTLDDRGHAQLRYKPEDDRTYTVQPAEIRPLEAGPTAPRPPRPPIDVWIHVGAARAGSVPVGILLAWRDRRREIVKDLPAVSDDELAVGAVLAALRAIRKPDWPVRVHLAAGPRIAAMRDGAGTSPPACGEALRAAVSRFDELSIEPLPHPPPRDAEHAARLTDRGASP